MLRNYREIDPELGVSFIEEYQKALAFVKGEPLVMRILTAMTGAVQEYEVHEDEIRIKAVAVPPYF